MVDRKRPGLFRALKNNLQAALDKCEHLEVIVDIEDCEDVLEMYNMSVAEDTTANCISDINRAMEAAVQLRSEYKKEL